MPLFVRGAGALLRQFLITFVIAEMYPLRVVVRLAAASSSSCAIVDASPRGRPLLVISLKSLSRKA